jgi:hypothetical protein
MPRLAFVALLLTALLVSACAAVPPTGDNAQQFLSAQTHIPPPPAGYQTLSGDSLQTTLSGALTAAGLGTGNVLGAALANRADALATCYREVGALDLRGYYKIGTRDAGAGVALVVNVDRITGNFVQCVTQAAGVSAQSADFQPCIVGGQFSATEGSITNNFTYMYAGSTPELCAHFASYFAGKPAPVAR